MFINKSQECCKSELDLFSLPPTQVSVESGITVNIQPHPNIAEGPIQFDIPADVKYYLDTSQTLLKIKCNIIKQGGTQFVAADKMVQSTTFYIPFFLNAKLLQTESKSPTVTELTVMKLTFPIY
jgi:hypothetical protein